MSDFRAKIAALAAIDTPLELRGETITGASLAMLVSVNPELGLAESARTPQIISELGRLLAAANYEKEIAEVRYRVWRDGVVHQVSTDLEYAQNVGAVDEEAKKPMSRTAAGDWVRTHADYANHYEAKLRAEEVYLTIHGAFEAAKARTRVIANFEYQSGSSAPSRSTAPPPIPGGVDDDGVERHPGYTDRPDPKSSYAPPSEEAEAAVEALSATTTVKPGPPGPPPPPPRS